MSERKIPSLYPQRKEVNDLRKLGIEFKDEYSELLYERHARNTTIAAMVIIFLFVLLGTWLGYMAGHEAGIQAAKDVTVQLWGQLNLVGCLQ